MNQRIVVFRNLLGLMCDIFIRFPRMVWLSRKAVEK